MVRKGGNTRVSSKRPTTVSSVVGPSLPPIGQPAITYGGNGGSHSGGTSHHPNHLSNGLVNSPGKNAVVVLAPTSAAGAEDGIHCPQCNIPFDDGKFRRVTDSCGHVKCRFCIVASEEGCVQCGLGGSSPASGAESGSFNQYNHHQNSKKGPTIVDVTKQSSGPVTSHHLTRRAAAAHRLLSGANSRTNSVNSARPTSSSPSSSASNDTGRQSSSVYSDSADSDSCLRFSSSIASGVENDGYPATIDFEAMAELTSPNLETGYMSISDYSSNDNKSYTSIINEDSEFSKSLMSLRKLQEPSIHNNNNNSTNSSSTNTILGTPSHGGLVTRAQLKEMPSLALVSTSTSAAVPTSPSSLNRVPNESSSSSSSSTSSALSKRRSRDSSKPGSKIATGGGSPDITEGVPRESPKLSTSSPRMSPPAAKTNSSPGETEGNNSSIAGSRLGALLTRSSSRNSREKVIEIPVKAIPSTSSYQSTKETREVHSSSVEDPSASSSSKKGKNLDDPISDFVDEQVVKEEEGSIGDDDGSGDDSKGEDEDDDDTKMEIGEGGDDPVPKKKKKRSPVVIHDHITVLGGEPPMYQCNVCQKKFKTKAHIKYHEFCQKGDKPFKCEQCGQGFIAKSHYEYHLRTHTGERPYVCPKCGKGFNQRGKVTRHMRSHTGEKPFVCQECNRGFANAQALRSHTLIHTGERPFACTYCNKRFTGMTNLKKHVITHTGERPFSCNHCGKSFGLKWTLDLHLRTHSSERPYACDQCSRAFSNSKDLRRHLVIHSGERPFKCWICGTAFRRKDNLDRHIKNTHNQPKEVAKKLANEAAAEYLKQTTKNQSLGNIPVSKVNSVVISNIIKNADLMPAGGIVPNNLHNKFKQSGKSSNQSNVKVVPKVSNSPGASCSTSNATSKSPSTGTATPSSVQQSSPTSRRRVVITAPLSPPTTRASRSKETDSNKIQLRNSTISLSPTNRKGKTANKQTDVKAKGASTQPTPPVHHKKEKVSAPLLVPKEESDVPKVVTKEKKRKSKKKKAKKSKSKRKEKKPSPPSPQIAVKSNKRGRRRKSSGNDAKEEVEVSENAVDVERDQRLLAVNFCDDLDQRRPTLTLVTSQSPKKEEDDDEVSTSVVQRLSTPPPPPPPPLVIESTECEHSSFLERSEAEDEQVECILPHDINEIDEADLMDTLAADSDGTSPNEKEPNDISFIDENESVEEVEFKVHDENVEEKAEQLEDNKVMADEGHAQVDNNQLKLDAESDDKRTMDGAQINFQNANADDDNDEVESTRLNIEEENIEEKKENMDDEFKTHNENVDYEGKENIDQNEIEMEGDQVKVPKDIEDLKQTNENQVKIHEENIIEVDDDEAKVHVEEASAASTKPWELDITSEIKDDDNLPKDDAESADKPELSTSKTSTPPEHQTELADEEATPVDSTEAPSSSPARSPSPVPKKASSTDPDSMPASPSLSDKNEKSETSPNPEISDIDNSNEENAKIEDNEFKIDVKSFGDEEADNTEGDKLKIYEENDEKEETTNDDHLKIEEESAANELEKVESTPVTVQEEETDEKDESMQLDQSNAHEMHIEEEGDNLYNELPIINEHDASEDHEMDDHKESLDVNAEEMNVDEVKVDEENVEQDRDQVKSHEDFIDVEENDDDETMHVDDTNTTPSTLWESEVASVISDDDNVPNDVVESTDQPASEPNHPISKPSTPPEYQTKLNEEDPVPVATHIHSTEPQSISSVGSYSPDPKDPSPPTDLESTSPIPPASPESQKLETTISPKVSEYEDDIKGDNELKVIQEDLEDEEEVDVENDKVEIDEDIVEMEENKNDHQSQTHEDIVEMEENKNDHQSQTHEDIVEMEENKNDHQSQTHEESVAEELEKTESSPLTIHEETDENDESLQHDKVQLNAEENHVEEEEDNIHDDVLLFHEDNTKRDHELKNCKDNFSENEKDTNMGQIKLHKESIKHDENLVQIYEENSSDEDEDDDDNRLYVDESYPAQSTALYQSDVTPDINDDDGVAKENAESTIKNASESELFTTKPSTPPEFHTELAGEEVDATPTDSSQELQSSSPVEPHSPLSKQSLLAESKFIHVSSFVSDKIESPEICIRPEISNFGSDNENKIVEDTQLKISEENIGVDEEENMEEEKLKNYEENTQMEEGFDETGDGGESVQRGQLNDHEKHVEEEEDDMHDDLLIIHEDSNEDDDEEVQNNQMKDREEKEMDQVEMQEEIVEEDGDHEKRYEENSMEEEDDDDDNRLYVDESYTAPTALSQSDVPSEISDDDNVLNDDAENTDKPTSESELSASKPSTPPELCTKLSEGEPDVTPMDSTEQQSSSPVGSPSPAPKEASSTDPDSMPASPSASDENDKPEITLPPEISDFVLSVLDNRSNEFPGKMDDLESISSASLASPQSDVENSIKMCIQTLESDSEEESSAQISKETSSNEKVDLSVSSSSQVPVSNSPSLSTSPLSASTSLITSSFAKEKHLTTSSSSSSILAPVISHHQKLEPVHRLMFPSLSSQLIKLPAVVPPAVSSGSKAASVTGVTKLREIPNPLIRQPPKSQYTPVSIRPRYESSIKNVTPVPEHERSSPPMVPKEQMALPTPPPPKSVTVDLQRIPSPKLVLAGVSDTLTNAKVSTSAQSLPAVTTASEKPTIPIFTICNVINPLRNISHVSTATTYQQSHSQMSSSTKLRNTSLGSNEAPALVPEVVKQVARISPPSFVTSPAHAGNYEQLVPTSLPPTTSKIGATVVPQTHQTTTISIPALPVLSESSDVMHATQTHASTSAAFGNNVEIGTTEVELNISSASPAVQLTTSKLPSPTQMIHSHMASEATTLLQEKQSEMTVPETDNNPVMSKSLASTLGSTPTTQGTLLNSSSWATPVKTVVNSPSVFNMFSMSAASTSSCNSVTESDNQAPASTTTSHDDSVMTTIQPPVRINVLEISKDMNAPQELSTPFQVFQNIATTTVAFSVPVAPDVPRLTLQEPATPKLTLVETFMPKPVDTRGPRLTLVDHGIPPAKIVPSISLPPAPIQSYIETKTPQLFAVEQLSPAKVIHPITQPVAQKLPSFEMKIPKLTLVEALEPNKPSFPGTQLAIPSYTFTDTKSLKLETISNSMDMFEDDKIPKLTLVQHIPPPKIRIVDPSSLMDPYDTDTKTPPSQSSPDPPVEKVQRRQSKKSAAKAIQQQVASTNVPTTSHSSIQPRINGMVSSPVGPGSQIPSLTLSASKVSNVSTANSTLTISTQSKILTEAGNKRPHEEYYQAVPTRVQFLLPQSAPPVSTVADATTPSVSVSTTTHPTTTPVAYDPSLLYFVQSDGQQAFEGNYQLVYAAAAATTERDEGVIDGPPNKVRLLYAEALGVGSDSQNGNELQFYYAATAPDQQVQQTSSSPYNVQLMEPCRVTYSQTTNDARSEMLQYHVQHNQEQQHQQNSQNLSQQQQQVLNLSVNSNPVYYYNYSSTATVSHPPPSPPPPPQPGQQQSLYNDQGQYSSTSTAKLVVANQNAYPEMDSSHLQHHNYRQYSHGNTEAQDLSSRRLDLPVHTARSNEIAYAHVRSNDPVQYNFLEKAREVQHVFPQGAFRHCDSNMSGYGSHLSSISSQNMPNGVLSGYAKNGTLTMDNMGSTGSSSASGSSGILVDPNAKMSGLDLLSAATEKIKAMQYEALCTERAAAAIAAVGELARLKRLGSRQQQDSQQQSCNQMQPQLQIQDSSSPYTFPSKPPGDGIATIPNDQHSIRMQHAIPNHRNSPQYQPQQVPIFQGHSQQTAHHEMPMSANPEDQQAGIRRGPRKYYLSRSAQYQD